MMKDVLLSARNISKEFEKNKVINNVTVDIYKGDFTIIMGASGAGKSTLLYALSGMDKITNGNVLYKNKDITKNSEKQMAKLRIEEFGFVFQQAYLVSNLTLFENVAVAGYLNNNMTTKQAREKANKLLEGMNLEKAKNRLPVNTSGGETRKMCNSKSNDK